VRDVTGGVTCFGVSALYQRATWTGADPAPHASDHADGARADSASQTLAEGERADHERDLDQAVDGGCAEVRLVELIADRDRQRAAAGGVEQDRRDELPDAIDEGQQGAREDPFASSGSTTRRNA
jgi:hypothetical protein